MAKIEIIRGFSVSPRRAEVLRLLGGNSPSKPVRPQLEAQIASVEIFARSIVHPMGCFGFWQREEVEDCRIMGDLGLPASIREGLSFLALGLVTIGREIDAAIATFLERRMSSQATILDALGSEYAESAVEFVLEEIRRSGNRQHANCVEKPRISPGYADWGLEAQKVFFDLLPASELGVTLTAGGVMDPRKSVSFLVPFSLSGAEDRSPACDRCGMEHCHFKRGGGVS